MNRPSIKRYLLNADVPPAHEWRTIEFCAICPGQWGRGLGMLVDGFPGALQVIPEKEFQALVSAYPDYVYLNESVMLADVPQYRGGKDMKESDFFVLKPILEELKIALHINVQITTEEVQEQAIKAIKSLKSQVKTAQRNYGKAEKALQGQLL